MIRHTIHNSYLYSINFFPPKNSGAEMGKPTIAILSYQLWKHPRALKLAHTLAKYGYRVKVWGSRTPVVKGPRIIRNMLNYFIAFFEVASIKSDMYWVENVPDTVYLSLPFLGRKYVYDRRSPWAREVSIEFNASRFILRIIESIERYMMKKALCIVVASTPMKHEYEFGSSVYVVPNYPEKSFIREVKTTIREKLGIPPSTKVFGFVGKLTRIEGADLLVDVAAKLSDIENAELWIIGDGPLGGTIKKISEKFNNVRWFGWINRKDLPPYIASLDYGLVPRHKNPYKVFYNHEGIAKIGEYFAYGKPVIASGIAPSPYYMVVEPEEFAGTVARVARGELEPPKPPRSLLWETLSEAAVKEVVEKCLHKT